MAGSHADDPPRDQQDQSLQRCSAPVTNKSAGILLAQQIKTRKHRQSYRHADPRWQRHKVAQRHIGMRNMGYGH